MPTYTNLQERGVFQFQNDSAGNLRYNFGTTAPFGLKVQEDLLVVGNVETQGASMEVRATGDVIAFFSSDQRMKDNIFIINDPLEKINSLRGVTFNWNDKGPKWTKLEKWKTDRDVGVIAQEVQKVLPEAVRKRENGYLSVDYKRLTPLLIEGIKEQQKQIVDLQSRINKLENK